MLGRVWVKVEWVPRKDRAGRCLPGPGEAVCLVAGRVPAAEAPPILRLRFTCQLIHSPLTTHSFIQHRFIQCLPGVSGALETAKAVNLLPGPGTLAVLLGWVLDLGSWVAETALLCGMYCVSVFGDLDNQGLFGLLMLQ